MFGNISLGDVRRTVAALPLLVAGGTVVWTRGTEDMDRTPQIREWFASSGFAEVGFRKTSDRAFTGGAQRRRPGAAGRDVSQPADAIRLFTFR